MVAQPTDTIGPAVSGRPAASRGPTASRRICDEAHYPAALLAVAARGLPGACRPFPARSLEAGEWATVLREAGAHRMTGFLRAAVDSGDLPATAVQVQEARRAHRLSMVRVLSLEGELLRVVDLLAAAGVEARVLKGSAVAHLDYPDPALRPFIDLDVAVRPEAVDRAVAAFVGAGLVRTLPEPRPGFDRRFDKGVTLRHPHGYGLDLHRTFVLGPWGLRVDLDALWDQGQEFTVGGRPLRALSPHHRFVHACYHAALGDWPLRLVSLRDVAQMALALDRDAAALRRLTARWGIDAVVAAAVTDAWRLLGLEHHTEISAWARRYTPTRREVAQLALHTHPGKTFTAQALSTLRTIPRWRDKAAYARALVLPDAAYTQGRHRSAMARFRFAIGEARRGRGR